MRHTVHVILANMYYPIRIKKVSKSQHVLHNTTHDDRCYFFVWDSGDFALPCQDYTSSSLVIHFVICQSPVGIDITVSVLSSLDTVTGRLPFWSTSGTELLCYTGVQSDPLSPVERSGSTFSVSLSNRPFLTVPLSPPKTRCSRFRFYFSSFFLTQKNSINHVPDTGEGRVIGLDYDPMFNGFTDINIFRKLHTQDELVIYILLPSRMMSWVVLHIMMSTLVTVCWWVRWSVCWTYTRSWNGDVLSFVPHTTDNT